MDWRLHVLFVPSEVPVICSWGAYHRKHLSSSELNCVGIERSTQELFGMLLCVMLLSAAAWELFRGGLGHRCFTQGFSPRLQVVSVSSLCTNG